MTTCRPTRPQLAPLALGLSCALLGVPPAAVTAQSLSVSPRLSVMQGNQVAGSLGLRVEVGGPLVGIYGHTGRFGVGQTCETSLPPNCSSPSGGGTELTGGITLTFNRSQRVYPVLSLGAGALFWSDDPPYRSGVGTVLEAELDVRAPAFLRSELSVGVRVASISQSVSGGMRLYGDQRPVYAGLVAGLVVPLPPK